MKRELKIGLSLSVSSFSGRVFAWLCQDPSVVWILGSAGWRWRKVLRGEWKLSIKGFPYPSSPLCIFREDYIRFPPPVFAWRCGRKAARGGEEEEKAQHKAKTGWAYRAREEVWRSALVPHSLISAYENLPSNDVGEVAFSRDRHKEDLSREFAVYSFITKCLCLITQQLGR